jgi:GTP-binding protein
MTTAAAALPRVAIVGRPNVGKSSLFNRIVGERRAIVEDEPGTTRDRNESTVEWLGTHFRLVDTGGYEESEADVYLPLIAGQVRAELAMADVVLFCVDARDGLTSADHEIAQVVREAGRVTFVVATKADNERRESVGIAEASRLGLGLPMPVSALHDVNVGSLLDDVVRKLPRAEAPAAADRVRVAVIGRPNVGKSMLVNRLLGDSRVIVSDVAGTTRDAIDTDLDAPEGVFTLVDTAGVRRPGKLGLGVERHSVMRTRQAVERADVAVLVVDGTVGVTAQDTHIAGIALEAQTGLIIAVNKTDLWEDRAERLEWAKRQMKGRVAFAPWAMVTFTSALSGRGLPELLKLAVESRDARRRRISTGELNTVLRTAFRKHGPAVVRHKRLKLLYATQASIEPPTFVLFVNDPAIVHFSYRRYLERAIRESLDFEGTAIELTFRSRMEPEAEATR